MILREEGYHGLNKHNHRANHLRDGLKLAENACRNVDLTSDSKPEARNCQLAEKDNENHPHEDNRKHNLAAQNQRSL